ncbi:hypothetical protein BT93_K1435 [Corymbia citriodora subsp. variegata]|nr:hypothetical protein BT93_K1435 [Corymbia citriodora subsp. variegata]KAF8007424.1 hypothetical protein BT93_K1435 [Corymbia citriodora subsp. variegata]KAF8007425.1 hypothetical protein BT93_K1435 [Corymbia citriodora subsp. variegata]
MSGESHLSEAGGIPKKRKSGHKKSHKAKKKVNVFPGAGEKIKIDNRMRKLFRKRAREYNSDDDEDEEVAASKDDNAVPQAHDEENLETHGLDDDEPEVSDDEKEEEDDDEVHPGIIKFTEGVRAFKTAFQSVIKKSVSDDSLGPVMSAHKKLVAEKLAEEETERKAKGEVKKAKHLVGEKGHAKPANYLDAHEKFLISVATKGVVKLFNAVNKAQNAQKGLNASRSRDAKAIKNRRKEAFFSELSKPSLSSAKTPAKVQASTSAADSEPPAWAPLRDNYMLTNSKLKDWDKMQELSEPEDFGRGSEDSSSDDD